MPGTVDPVEAARLGPWWFRFEVDGQRFGGETPRDTERVATFHEWLGRSGGCARTILELGAHEGNHSLQLAALPHVKRVLALEGRDDNLARARYVQHAYGVRNVEFRQANIEQLDPAELGRFDAVFCAGLLYHLPEPWLLIERLAQLTRWLFLDTHYAAGDDEVLGLPYRGRWQREGVGALSGLSQFSFWLSFRQLVLMLLEHGFGLRFAHDRQISNGPRVWLLAEQVGYEHAGGELADAGAPQNSSDERESLLQAELAEACASVAAVSDELAEARATAASVSDELAAVRATLSWRVTRPLRSIRRHL